MTQEGWSMVELVLDPEVEPDGAELDLMSGVLFGLGAGGLETRDQNRPIVVIAAFPPEATGSGAIEMVQEELHDAGVRVVSMDVRAFEPVDWATHWRQHFQPLCFGDPTRGLWIVPSWLEPPQGAAHVLRIDPSRAFGTGLHATTALCIERVVELSPIPSLLDVGTGTGVLAMAALRLGGRRALGTDNDPEAIEVAEENAALNGMQERVELSGAAVEDLTETFDVVVANILAGPLAELAPSIASRVAVGGRVILSGVLGHQADEVVQAYLRTGLKDPVITPREEWVRIELVRTGS